MRNESFWSKIREHIIRERSSRGYGIHSPFIFRLVTFIIREKYPYYSYLELAVVRKRLLAEHRELNQELSRSTHGLFNLRKVDELIFRLVNFAQPQRMLEIGTGGGLTSLYMHFARKSSACITLDTIASYNQIAENTIKELGGNITFLKGDVEMNLKKMVADNFCIDFIVFHPVGSNKKNWEVCMENIADHSVCVICGINKSDEMKKFWQDIIADSRAVLTFDIKEVGLVLFDSSRTKQHYILTL